MVTFWIVVSAKRMEEMDDFRGSQGEGDPEEARSRDWHAARAAARAKGGWRPFVPDMFAVVAVISLAIATCFIAVVRGVRRESREGGGDPREIVSSTGSPLRRSKDIKRANWGPTK